VTGEIDQRFADAQVELGAGKDGLNGLPLGQRPMMQAQTADDTASCKSRDEAPT
jgi:hypothetical protein